VAEPGPTTTDGTRPNCDVKEEFLNVRTSANKWVFADVDFESSRPSPGQSHQETCIPST
jgi:hypothetical protein